MKRGAATGGFLWTGLEKVLVQGIVFAQSVVLARLLLPEEFGLVAMLGLFLALANVFAEGGFSVALVQNRVFASRDERAVFLFSLGVAAACTLLLCAAAPAIAAFYGEPRLTAILRVLAAGVVFNAVSGLAAARLQRTMRFAAMARLNVFCAAATALAAALLAWRGFGVWTIVFAGTGASVLRAALFSFAARGIAAPGGAGDGGQFGTLLRFGWKLTAAACLSVVYRNVSALLLGARHSAADAGLFTRALTWAELPGNVASEAAGRVALPLLSRADGPDGRRRARRACAWLAMAALLPALAVFWFFAAPVVTFVFGPSWTDAAPLVRILALGVAVAPLAGQNAQVLNACGRGDWVLAVDLVRRPAGLAALVVGGCFGLEGLCWAKVAADLVDWLVVSFFSRRLTGASFLREALAL